MVIKLVEGNKYKFVATMVVDGKEKISGTVDGYLNPFYNGSSMPLNNTFALSNNTRHYID